MTSPFDHERQRRDQLARCLERHGYRDPRVCPECGRRMTVFHAVLGSPELSAHCVNVACSLRTVTLPLGSHPRLTAAQRAAYASMNQRQRERREAWLAELAESLHGKAWLG